MRRLLIVTPHFPPINAPDMQRVRMSLPHYAINGWEAVVLAVADRRQEGVREPELALTVPPGIRVVRTGAVPAKIARLAGIGNIGLRAWPFLLRAGLHLLRREKFDLVFFSTTQFNVLTLGPIWHRRRGVPYVIDVQDPWLTDHYEKPGAPPPPGGWKYRFARVQGRLLEGRAFAGAAGIMSVSPDYLASLRERYPAVAATPSAVIDFGTSREDLARARILPPSAYSFARGRGERHIVYTGAAGPLSPRLLALLFAALRRFRESDPARGGRLRLHFLGTSYVSPPGGTPAILPLAGRCGIADLVSEVPHRLGYFEALQLQQQADALLLVGSDDPAYSPSKLFPYYLTRRPILGLVFGQAMLTRQLDELACAFVVRWSPGESEDRSEAELRRFFEQTADGVDPVPASARDDAAFDSRFLAEALTRRQCALFDAAVRNPQP